ncbi:MAG: hypothetical protein ABR947_04585 [Solirubrobacteraceae bacterium]|jgi:hypothetical protein
MTHESYKAWLDEMPIDDVRRRIERLEKKLWDLHVLERLYDERRGGGEEEAAGGGGEPNESAPTEGEPASEWHEHGAQEGEPASEGGEHGAHEGEPTSEGGEEHAGG